MPLVETLANHLACFVKLPAEDHCRVPPELSSPALRLSGRALGDGSEASHGGSTIAAWPGELAPAALARARLGRAAGAREP
jgi:hypothetical protein